MNIHSIWLLGSEDDLFFKYHRAHWSINFKDMCEKNSMFENQLNFTYDTQIFKKSVKNNIDTN